MTIAKIVNDKHNNKKYPKTENNTISIPNKIVDEPLISDEITDKHKEP